MRFTPENRYTYVIIIIIIITLFHEGNIIKLYNLFTIWPSITKKTRTIHIV